MAKPSDSIKGVLAISFVLQLVLMFPTGILLVGIVANLPSSPYLQLYEVALTGTACLGLWMESFFSLLELCFESNVHFWLELCKALTAYGLWLWVSVRTGFEVEPESGANVWRGGIFIVALYVPSLVVYVALQKRQEKDAST